MRGINTVTLIGNVGNKPEIFESNTTKICRISVATNDEWTDKNTGEKQVRTEWHRVSVFGGQAQACFDYLISGARIYVQGKLKTSKYEKNGQDVFSTSIVVSGMGTTILFLDKKKGDLKPIDQLKNVKPDVGQIAGEIAKGYEWEDVPF